MFYKESLCPPLHYRTGLSPCNLSPINVVGFIVSVDLDRGYQMVARYCRCVTCHVSRGVMTRASTVPGPRRARCMLSCSVCISRDDRGALTLCHQSFVSACTGISAANRLIGEVVQSRRRPLLGPSPGWKRLLAFSDLRHY